MLNNKENVEKNGEQPEAEFGRVSENRLPII